MGSMEQATVSGCLLAHAWHSGWRGHLGMSGAMKCAVFWGAGMHVKADRSIQSNPWDHKE